jgi:short subunit dehydrogenase-like uncharacterized protein
MQYRIFDLQHEAQVAAALKGMKLVLHCAGPFSATSAKMIAACLRAGAHYLDITGEISVLEHAHRQGAPARAAGIVICPGVGFDVIPTDCIAASLKAALPDATHLALGFHTPSRMSPGTGKTLVESLATGGKIRKDGKIISVPFAHKTRRIDFGGGEEYAMTVPWGDVSTAFYTTGIPNIEVYTTGSRALLAGARNANHVRWLLELGPAQRLLKGLIQRMLKGPDSDDRDAMPSYIWGEASNDAGVVKTARIKTANGYSLTVTGALAVVEHLLQTETEGGTYTPARLIGPDFVVRLPGSGLLMVE